MARKPLKGKSLAEVNPELAKQWHPTKNGDLTPFDFSSGSDYKAWWKCNKGEDHEWRTNVYKRSSGRGCSICSGRKVVNSNCLSTTHPEIANQWHPTKNGELTPHNVSYGSNKEVWWRCNKGDDHIWQTKVAKRSGGESCTICSGRKIVKSNCLATTHPKIANQWHSKLNHPISPIQITKGMIATYWWKCDEGNDHIWEASPNNRTRGKGCPICSGNKVVNSNCLSTTHPEIANQWHPTKNGELTPNDVSFGSDKNIWWKCNKGDDHEWETTVSHRSEGTNCPICCGQDVVISNSLYTLNPILAKEWHPTKNGELTPLDITLNSGKVFWWKCINSEDHIWIASVAARNYGNGCPSCTEYGFNRSEDALFYIRKINLDNGKQALKFGITNNMDGGREKQQSRNVEGSVNTILREKVSGEIALDIENLCKKCFGKKGFLTKEEFPDGFTETIKYSDENLNKIKSMINDVLTEKAEKNS